MVDVPRIKNVCSMAIDVKEQAVKLSKDIQHDVPMLVDWHHNDNNSTISSCLLECRALVGQSCSKVEQQQTPMGSPHGRGIATGGYHIRQNVVDSSNIIAETHIYPIQFGVIPTISHIGFDSGGLV
uniref:Uncharacterized protein n=1 Tax=Romanomermis culicivorax TaxID=13658 RepID=A0A915K1W8_ROMCU